MGVNDPLAMLEGAMVFDGIGFPSHWGHNEFNLGGEQRIVEMQWESEFLKMTAKEEIRKRDEEIKRLIKERDEAWQQLQMLHSLLMKFMPMNLNMTNNAAETSPVTSHLQLESPQPRPPRANSGTTESDSSYVSSPVESFLDANMADSCYNIAVPHNPMHNNKNHNNNNKNNNNVVAGSEPDDLSARLEQLVSKRPLPEKGDLVQAVMRAGPLLQNLLVAGPLPRWKNPPPPQQLRIPPVPLQGRNSLTLNQTAGLGPIPVLQNSLHALHYDAPLKRPMQLASPCAVATFHFPDAKKQRSL